jgi:hypothetical protein
LLDKLYSTDLLGEARTDWTVVISTFEEKNPLYPTLLRNASNLVLQEDTNALGRIGCRGAKEKRGRGGLIHWQRSWDQKSKPELSRFEEEGD